MDVYDFDIEKVTPQTCLNWGDDGSESDGWSSVFGQHLGKFMITEIWMLGEEKIGDCQTLMTDQHLPLFFESIAEAETYIYDNYQTNTKAVQKVRYR
jgi:hypothetical protein